MQNPAEFERAVEALTPYLVESGNWLVLQAPENIVQDLDQDVYAALVNNVERVNSMVAEESITVAAIGPIVREFVKRYWRQIVRAAKNAGVWAWHKAHICAGGAANALYRAYGNNPDQLVVDPASAVAVAAAGCIAALR